MSAVYLDTPPTNQLEITEQICLIFSSPWLMNVRLHPQAYPPMCSVPLVHLSLCSGKTALNQEYQFHFDYD